MLNHKPKVSIIMPTYNGSRFIQRSIDSVLSQTLKDFELIIINDGSTDRTKEIIKKYQDKRIVYLENKKNLGVSKARNIGLRQARGDYIAYCDHDDIYYPQHIESLANILDNYSEIGLVYAKCKIVESGKLKREIPYLNFFSKPKLETENIIGPPLNVMHRAKCIELAGDFDRSHIIRKYDSEDRDLWLRISDYFNCYHIKDVLGEFIHHSGNRSLNLDFTNSYNYILEKRIRKARNESKLLEYINNCSIEIVRNLIAYKKLNYAYILANNFYKTVKNYQTFACVAFCEIAKGNFRKAKPLLETSLKKLPKGWHRLEPWRKKDILTIKIYLAKAYYKLNDVERGIRINKEVLKAEPKNLTARIQLAQFYMEKGNYKKALNLINNMDNTADICNLRGYYYFKNKKFKQAIKEFKMAVELEPDIAIYKRNLLELTK